MSSETAENLILRAEKKRQGGFFSFFTGGPNLDEAASLYVKAANKYKLDKKPEQASKCFIDAATLSIKAGDKNQAASYYVEAGNLKKKYSVKDAETWFFKAVEIYVEQGRFGQSGKLLKTLAENYLNEGDYDSAITYFKKAAEYFDMDEYGTSNFAECTVKYADLVSRLRGSYEEAIEIYENEAKRALRNNLLQYNAKKHFFKAAILHIVIGDMVNARIAIERYEGMDTRTGNSEQFHLLHEMMAAVEAADLDSFVASIDKYDRIHRLEDWDVIFLYKIKERLGGGPKVEYAVDKTGLVDLT